MRKEDIDLPEEIKKGLNREMNFSANSNIFSERKNFDYNPIDSNKVTIGISVENKDSLYGDVIIACIAVPEGYNEKDYEKARKELNFNTKNIKPYQIETKEELEKWEMKYIIDLLNEIPEFWKHEIRISCDYTKDEFIERFYMFLPVNLLKNKAINPENWIIRKKKEKECALASIFAREIINEDIKYINSLYGNIGKGDKNDIKVLSFIKESLDNLPSFVRRSFEPIKSWIKNG